MREYIANEFIHFVQETPNLLRDLVRYLGIPLPSDMKPCVHVSAALESASLHLGQNTELQTLGLLYKKKEWVCFDVVSEIVPQKRWLWRSFYGLALQHFQSLGQCFLLAQSTSVAAWCKGTSFGSDVFRFRPTIINLRLHVDVLLASSDENIALLGFWAHPKSNTNQLIPHALRIVTLASARSKAEGLRMASWVFQFGSKRMRAALWHTFVGLVHERNQTQRVASGDVTRRKNVQQKILTEVSPMVTKEIKNLIAYIEEQTYNKIRRLVLQHLLCKQLERCVGALSEAEKTLVGQLQDATHLEDILQEAYAGTSKNDGQVILQRIEKMI